MIVIIEGPDGAGKSTLANALAREYKLEYHHEGVPPPGANPLIHYGKLLQGARGRDVVFDRLALGERVYGPILRKNETFGIKEWTVFRRLIWASGAHQVMCLPDVRTCVANWRLNQKNELIKDERTYIATYEAFEALLERDTIVFDFDRDLVPHLDRKPELEWDMIGAPGATHLFVGERGGDPNHPLDLPFFATNNSAGYLNECLQLAGYGEPEITFINAFHQRDTKAQQIPKGYQRVIALGEEASTVCREQGLEHIGVPHPQFWKRFRHQDKEGYAKLLREAHL